MNLVREDQAWSMSAVGARSGSEHSTTAGRAAMTSEHCVFDYQISFREA
jgi:hypothetical protein